MKTVIKGLINRSKVKLEYVQAIAEALENEQTNETYWEDIFNAQGAEDALKQGIYSPQMVRLLTLRAIVIPQTLPEYLVWLGNGNQQNENYIVSAEFQFQIRKSLNQIPPVAKNIEFNIIEGIRLLLPKLLEQKVSVEAVAWLLASLNGLWARFTHQFLQDIEHDLQLMSQFVRGSKDLEFKLADKSWLNIWNELKKYWQMRSCVLQEKYQSFAKLFEQLHQYKLAAFFYHIGFGKVTKEIFIQVCPSGYHCLVYGINTERELTIPETFLLTALELGSIEMRIPFVILIVQFSFLLGYIFGNLAPTNHRKTSLNDFFQFLDENVSFLRALTPCLLAS